MSDEMTSDARHRQIARELRHDIESGRLQPGQRLPSTRELAGQFNVSIGAINDAMEILTKEGLVVSRPRSGRVVADHLNMSERERLQRTRPHAVLIGGYAGSGKTEFGRILARETKWAILDKDTLTRSIVDTTLVQLGSSIQDRESSTYLDVVRPAEYECLEAAMIENVACGISVVCTAPFLREFKQRAWFDRTAASLNALGADMSVIWIRCDADSMNSYLKRRAAIRDTWKLTNWHEYLDQTVDMSFVPPWPHMVISNNLDSEPLQPQAKAFLRTLQE